MIKPKDAWYTLRDIKRAYATGVFHHLLRFPVTNDNSPVHMTGDFAKDAAALSRKWGFTDKQFLIWGMCPANFIQGIARTCGEASNSLFKDMPNRDAMVTATALGVMRFLFSLIDQLPGQEARLVLDHMAVNTDRTVRDFVGRGV